MTNTKTSTRSLNLFRYVQTPKSIKIPPHPNPFFDLKNKSVILMTIFISIRQRKVKIFENIKKKGSNYPLYMRTNDSNFE